MTKRLRDIWTVILVIFAVSLSAFGAILLVATKTPYKKARINFDRLDHKMSRNLYLYHQYENANHQAADSLFAVMQQDLDSMKIYLQQMQ